MRLPVRCPCGNALEVEVEVEAAMRRECVEGMRSAFAEVEKKLQDGVDSLGELHLWVAERVRLCTV